MRRLNQLDRAVIGPPEQEWPPDQIGARTFWDESTRCVVLRRGDGSVTKRYPMDRVRKVRYVRGRASYFVIRGPRFRFVLNDTPRPSDFLLTFLATRLDTVEVNHWTRARLKLPMTEQQARLYRWETVLINVALVGALLLGAAALLAHLLS